MTGWLLLVVAGWGATLVLGEPAATAGPGPTPAPTGPHTDPGPQPEGGPCSTLRTAARAAPGAMPSPSSTDWPPLGSETSDGRVVQYACDHAVAR